MSNANVDPHGTISTVSFSHSPLRSSGSALTSWAHRKRQSTRIASTCAPMWPSDTHSTQRTRFGLPMATLRSPHTHTDTASDGPDPRHQERLPGDARARTCASLETPHTSRRPVDSRRHPHRACPTEAHPTRPSTPNVTPQLPRATRTATRAVGRMAHTAAGPGSNRSRRRRLRACRGNPGSLGAALSQRMRRSHCQR